MFKKRGLVSLCNNSGGNFATATNAHFMCSLGPEVLLSSYSSNCGSLHSEGASVELYFKVNSFVTVQIAFRKKFKIPLSKSINFIGTIDGRRTFVTWQRQAIDVLQTSQTLVVCRYTSPLYSAPDDQRVGTRFLWLMLRESVRRILIDDFGHHPY